jgi:raffinose/stachyose/melibiose transport system permease protein
MNLVSALQYRLAASFGRWGTYLVVTVFSILVGYPVLWMFLASFKTKTELYINIWGLPETLYTANYEYAWRVSKMGNYILNSVIVSLSTVAIILVAASIAAYAFSRFSFRGKNILFFTFVFSMLVPSQVTIIPLYAVITQLKLTNTYLALILPYAAGGLPLSIFLLRAFFEGTPREVEDAAHIDGCSNLQTFLRVVLPVSTPGLATVTILQFMNAWNEFFLALIFIRQASLRTIPLGLQAFFFEFQVEWQYLFAALSMATIPVIVIYVMMQRQFIAGLTAGATKG